MDGLMTAFDAEIEPNVAAFKGMLPPSIMVQSDVNY